MVESTDELTARMKMTECGEDSFYDILVASVVRTFTKRTNPFHPPTLVISHEDLAEKVNEIMVRVSQTKDNFLHVTRFVCGVQLTVPLVERAIIHLVDRRGHLLLDTLPKGVYFIGEDLEIFLEQDPMYAPRRSGDVGDFVESVWRSVSGRRSQFCQSWRKRQRAQKVSSSPVLQEETGANTEPSLDAPRPPISSSNTTYSIATPKLTANRKVHFPSL